MPDQVEVVQGTLELLLLKVLSSGEALHGFGILGWLRQVTSGDLLVEEGALYPALHRMEGRGWVEGEWGISEKGRRAKFYRITAAGRSQLEREESAWARYIGVWEAISRAAEG